MWGSRRDPRAGWKARDPGNDSASASSPGPSPGWPMHSQWAWNYRGTLHVPHGAGECAGRAAVGLWQTWLAALSCLLSGEQTWLTGAGTWPTRTAWRQTTPSAGQHGPRHRRLPGPRLLVCATDRAFPAPEAPFTPRTRLRLVCSWDPCLLSFPCPTPRPATLLLRTPPRGLSNSSHCPRLCVQGA